MSNTSLIRLDLSFSQFDNALKSSFGLVCSALFFIVSEQIAWEDAPNY